MIADRDQADHHRAHLAQNRSQNQAFEGGCFNHLSRLIDRPTPDFLALSVIADAGHQSRKLARHLLQQDGRKLQIA